MNKSVKYIEVMLPFKYEYFKEDEEAGGISITAYGKVLDEIYFLYACYILKDKNMYDNGDYLEIINLLKNNNQNKKVKVSIKIKNNKVIDFKINIKSLSESYNDDRFTKLELLGTKVTKKISQINETEALNKKIVLGSNPKIKKVCNIVCIIMLTLWIILLLISIGFNTATVFNKIILLIITSTLTMVYITIFFNYLNEKIEIENSVITKVSLFNKKKVICNLSDITSFSNNYYNIVVLNNDKKIFDFLKNGRDDNLNFLKYLQNHYKKSFYIDRRLSFIIISTFTYFFLQLIIFVYSELHITYLLFSLALVLATINEKLKKFQITDNKTIIQSSLFYHKKINIADLTKVKIKEVYTGRIPGPIFFDVTGFNNKSKLFKIRLSPEELEQLTIILKTNGIKYYKN